MGTRVFRVDSEQPDRKAIKEAALVVEGGGLVAFPTETVYGIACRVERRSLQRLDKVKGRSPEKAYSLHIGEKGQVHNYIGSIDLRVSNLIERAWPGPLTIVFELDREQLEEKRRKFDGGLFESLYRGGSIGIRCPDHAIASMLLREARYPVVCPSANRSGEPAAVDAASVLERFSGEIELVLDGGVCKYGESSTVVRVGGRGLEILRSGVYSADEVERLWVVRIVFVCTGNTCRSPMAAGLFRKHLAEKLGYRVDELESSGYIVSSAGIVDTCGLPARPEAIASCAAKGVDIGSHRSRRLSEGLLKDSSLVFVMTRGQLEHVVNVWPEARGRCRLLGGSLEIADPMGHGQEIYNSCVDLIEAAVKERISELLQ